MGDWSGRRAGLPVFGVGSRAEGARDHPQFHGQGKSLGPDWALRAAEGLHRRRILTLGGLVLQGQTCVFAALFVNSRVPVPVSAGNSYRTAK